MNLRERQPSGAISVGTLTSVIKSVLETEFDEVLVKGEISNYKQHSSGHRYFTLKDEQAQISCVMWRTRQLDFTPADGMNVVVGGRVTVYPPRGNYQLDAVFMRPDGVGALYKAFEKLKQELEARGWFDTTRKKPLPAFPQCVGIATSVTGAALQDMLTTIQRRYAPLNIVLRPTLVQGEGSANDIARALADLQETSAEVIIVGRGGGSIEDLWSFNTEVVATAIVQSKTPVISAVGHETDFTIADFVADYRAATPTAAAEVVTPRVGYELVQWIDSIEFDLHETMRARIDNLLELVGRFVRGTALMRIKERLVNMSGNVTGHAKRHTTAVTNTLAVLRQSLTMHTNKQGVAINNRIALLQQRVLHGEKQIQSLHPHRPLKQGYAIVERNDSPLSIHSTLSIADNVRIVRWNEVALATVSSVTQINHGDMDEDH